MADWVTISSLATAGGTLALAGATYASVRSSNRSARLAELALQEQRRPVLVHSNDDDRMQAVSFGGGHQMSLAGGAAAVEVEADGVYLAASLRNVGEGIAVLQGWRSDGAATAEGDPRGRWRESMVKGKPPIPEEFRPLMRDQCIPERRPRLLAGGAARPRRPDLRPDRRRRGGGAPALAGPSLHRPGGRAANDQPLRPGAR
ncbi:MAG TPA: hypothetical protein VIM28_02760 [Solirubrobacterales bacterium]